MVCKQNLYFYNPRQEIFVLLSTQLLLLVYSHLVA